ncbi:DUF1697 domain-containing protein [Robiginitalea sp. IMCC44478]|uniref:DUF1697 domain-containing protein n=1 Tax=Robiginitalea sp. IMCC44478 TaxID=3459122 RepID=UPI0040436C61
MQQLKVFIGLLRGINVSGKNPVKMKDLKALLQAAGFKEVITYIQSGNLVFKTPPESHASLASRIEKTLADQFGVEIPVLIYSPEQWESVLASNPFIQSVEQDTASLYYIFWKSPPGQEVSDKLKAANIVSEEWALGANCLYIKCHKGYGNAKLNNNYLERLAGVKASTRNHRTLLKLAELASDQTG